ncbi:MAG TPA: ATPase domain-containing protein [Streptosporangiaceae bacterium]|nr:ATPase domain-containing protein [Streptosporangiaceae bacterium]
MTDGWLASGHAALDEVLGGGLPAQGISLIMGLPGTGKTIVAQQYAFHNADPERPVVYFSTVSEPLEKIVRFGQSLSFFDVSAVGKSVFYEDLGQTVGQDGLAGVAERVAATLRQRRPGLVIIDSFKALQVFADSNGDFRRFLHQLAGRLTAFPAASLWIGEYEPADAALLPEFAVADAIVELVTVRVGQRDMRFLEVRKLRGSGFLSGQHAYRLSRHGLQLFPRLADVPPLAAYALGPERISSGVRALDTMLAGGLWPGTATMVAGPSGAGKTVMGLHFIRAGTEHGEPGVIASLQENPTQLHRMLAGFGWPTDDPAIEIMYRSPVDIYIDEWVYDLLHTVERTGARRVLVDSLVDVQMAAPDETRFREFMYSLTQRLSRQGISLLMTCEVPELFGTRRLSESFVSHLSDNVIMLSYFQDQAQVKRVLSVIKTRASGHDPAMREFCVGPAGVTIDGQLAISEQEAISRENDTERS